MSRFVAFAAQFLIACSFSPGRLGGGDAGVVIDDDAPDAEVIVPDAAACTGVTAECIGDTLRKCSGPGATAMDRTCNWGCNATDAACRELAPSGGWETQSSGDTTSFTGLGNVSIPANAFIDTDNGTITGVLSGFDYNERPIGVTGRNAGVFRFRSLALADVRVIGQNALVLVADESITLTGVLDAVPLCDYTNVREPGPGGFGGGLNDFDGLPAPPGGGGIHGDTDNVGGGGGGHGTQGANGGFNPSSGGAVRGTAEIVFLLGGAGGGGGDDHNNSGRGGGGGAAIHLISNGPITINDGAGINAGGCGGRAGNGGNDGGGGGGAGGSILLEGRSVTIDGTLAANGGGGGGGAVGNANLTVGQKGQLGRTPATGGPAGSGGAGGAGGAGGTAPVAGESVFGSGGGGGIGRIRVNTRNGTVGRANAILSPGPSDPSTTYSEAQAAVR